MCTLFRETIRAMVSVIIPVYNVEQQISKCLNSLLNQTYKNWEGILVNDASLDSSLQICEEYAKRDSRFIVIRKAKNQGVEYARYDGMKNVRGRFVTFLDSDDWLDSTMLETCRNLMEVHKCDIVEMCHRRVMDRFGLVTRRGCGSDAEGLVCLPQLREKYYVSFFGLNNMVCNLWGKLYRTDLLKKFYPEPVGLTYAEDAYVNLKLFPHVRSVYFSKEIGYNYRWGGMTSRYNARLMTDQKKYYWLRRAVLEQEDIRHARYFLDVEAKNVLKSDIRQRLLYQKQDIRLALEEELRDRIWSEVCESLQSQPLRDIFSALLISGNAESMIKNVKEDLQRSRIRRFCIRAAAHILRTL